jgi:hypothetical protein
MVPVAPGNANGMHQLGFELPERTGFGGLWAAVAEAGEGVHATVGDVESAPEVVARCEGATSGDTRAAIASFRRTCCDADQEAPAAA